MLIHMNEKGRLGELVTIFFGVLLAAACITMTTCLNLI